MKTFVSCLLNLAEHLFPIKKALKQMFQYVNVTNN